MTLTKFRTLVATNWLRDELLALETQKSSTLRVLDASASLDPKVDGYKEFYLESHIPHSAYFNLHKLCPPSPPSLDKFPVPDVNRFQDYAESLGVSSDTHVVTYDRSNTIFALKTWWLFNLFGHQKVSVLDGGFIKWLKDGFEVSKELPTIERGSFTPAFNSAMLINFEDMRKNLKTQEKQVFDTRPADHFYNVKDKLPEGQKGGHIPGSKSLPYTTLLQEDGTFKSPEEIKAVFEAAGVDFGRPVVATCQRAMTACGLVASAYMLGHGMMPLYNGSFREWGDRAEPHEIEVD